MGQGTGMAALIGLDIGTTNCKLVAYSTNGDMLAEAVAGYEVRTPEPGHAELDPGEVMAAITDVFRKAAPSLAGIGELSLAISAQGEAFVPVDAAGDALMAAPISVDMRGGDAISAFNARPEVGEATEAAGQKLNALSSLSKLLWMKESEPRILENTAQILCLGEYVMRCLGVDPRMDYSMAARMGLLDNSRLQWSRELIELAGLAPSTFPSVTLSGTLIGMIDTTATTRLGLDVPVKIFAGGHDQACAMLGAGVVDSGAGLYSIGTTEAVAMTQDVFRPDLVGHNIDCYPHVIAGRFVALMGSQSGGRLLHWFKALRRIEHTDDLLADLPDWPSPVTVLPHFAGSGSVLADEMARGVLAGLSFETSPQDLTHAVLEGITFEQASSLARAGELGLGVERLRAVGGGTRAGAWMQIKADITGLPIDCIASPETACAGAAMLAGLGSGALPSLEEATSRFVRLGNTYSPRPDHTALYARKLALYHDMYLSNRQHRTSQSALAAGIDALKTGIGYED